MTQTTLSEADLRDLLRIAALARQILAAHQEPEKKAEHCNPGHPTEPIQDDITAGDVAACVGQQSIQRIARA